MNQALSVRTESVTHFSGLEDLGPAKPLFPNSHVRVLPLPDSTTEAEPESLIPEWQQGDCEIYEGRIVIGGIKMNEHEAKRAKEHTDNSRKLAIAGTVSHDSYRAKVENSRSTRLKRALGRVIHYMGISSNAEHSNFSSVGNAWEDGFIEDFAA